MSTMRTIFTALALFAFVALAAWAGAAKDQTKTEAPKKLKPQTHCPVMGGVIDSTAFTDIQGQRVYYCCPGCAEKFLADPDKYFRKAAAESVLFENIQTVCPIDGKGLGDKSVYADYEGRRIVLCGENCRAAFLKEPQKYLKGMDEAERSARERKTKERGAHDGCGHSHGGSTSCGG